MCVAYPGRVLSVDGLSAVVDFNGNKVSAITGLREVRPGDRVLVHAGCILQVIEPEEADELDEIFAELDAAIREDKAERESRAAGQGEEMT